VTVLLEVVPALVAGVLYARRTQTLQRDGRPVATWRRLCFAGGLLLATAGVVALNVLHRGLGTWQRAVDLYFTLTEFAKRKLVEGGLPADCETPVDFAASAEFDLAYADGPRVWRLASP
jgi:hypothetical protein